MDPDAPGLWLLPTLGRIETGLKRFLEACVRTDVTTACLILVDKEDYEANHDAYHGLRRPAHWQFKITNGRSVSEKLSEAIDVSRETQWLGYLQNDLVPETPGWDRRVIEALNGWNVVSTNDGNKAPKRMNGATAWSMDLVRAVGYLTVPSCIHFYLDDMWEEIGRHAGCWRVLMDVMVRHRHSTVLPHEADEVTQLANSRWDNDEKAWQKWRAEELGSAIERVQALMGEKGEPVYKPVLDGVSVMIATPCADGRYERLFLSGLINTLNEFKRLGASAEFAEMPYCSDISLARTKLFGKFLRSHHTHMLFIDDDMGWEAKDAVRLLELRKDFVVGVGPRKVKPVEFAWNVSDDYGRATPIKADMETGCLIASNTGLAFALISKHCAERMQQSYRDLSFVTADGKEEVGVFEPMIFNRRRLSEDFAFCERWRRLGGQVLVLQDINLQHVGAHVWEGDLLTYLEAKVALQRRAA